MVDEPASDEPDPLLGTVLAERYRIERRLGEGGMGTVYFARHVILEKAVALKILHSEYARRRELVERFLHEAKAASRIRHEHVIDITDFGETASKNVFFAMEYLDGRELAWEISRLGRIPWPRAKKIVLQVCGALQAAHEAGVIHRDLKPENIYLIDRAGNADFVKVLDFGVAKLTEAEDQKRRLTRTGMVFGTPEYMSPEQARGEKLDARVDVYAVGCILFEMVTGDVPYRADNFMGVLTRHVLDPIPGLAERADDVVLPPGLEEVLAQALAKNRDERFASMNELAVAVDTLDDLPSARPPVVRREKRTTEPPARAPAPASTPVAPVAPVATVATAPAAPAATVLPPPIPPVPSTAPEEEEILILPRKVRSAPPSAEHDIHTDPVLLVEPAEVEASLRRPLTRWFLGAAAIAAAGGGLFWVATRGDSPSAPAQVAPSPAPATTAAPTTIAPTRPAAPPPAVAPPDVSASLPPVAPAPVVAPAKSVPAPAPAAPPPPVHAPAAVAVKPGPPPAPPRPVATRAVKPAKAAPVAVKPVLVAPKKPEPDADVTTAPPVAPKSDLKDPFKKK